MLPDRLRRLLLGLRVGPFYVGICTRSQNIAVLRSGRGTYCWWHRYRQSRWLRHSRHADPKPLGPLMPHDIGYQGDGYTYDWGYDQHGRACVIRTGRDD